MDADATDAGDGDGDGDDATASVTGPPPEMAESRDDLTPMMSQYFDLCAAYDDALVLFQVGDFYEAFCAAAEAVSRVCEVTLTRREDSTGTYRMAGVPIDNAATYVDSLLEADYRVAIADQVEDPDEVSGVVERAVTRVVTPGTVTDDELLAPGTANYVACLAGGPDPDPAHAARTAADGRDVAGAAPDADVDLPPGAYAVALVDVSTGEVTVAGGSWATVCEEIERFDPAELVVDPRLSTPDVEADPAVTRGAHDPAVFGLDRATAALAEHVGPPSLTGDRAELRACGALLAYAEYTQGGTDGRLGHVSRLRCYDPDEYLRLDATAARSLELFETRSTGEGPTLRDTVDATVSAPGRRRLAAWLRQPLVDRDAVEARHDAVATLVDAPLVREDLREALAEVYDLERLVTRTTRARADARDLCSLRTTLDVVPDVLDALDRLDRPSDGDGDGDGDDDATPADGRCPGARRRPGRCQPRTAAPDTGSPGDDLISRRGRGATDGYGGRWRGRRRSPRRRAGWRWAARRAARRRSGRGRRRSRRDHSCPRVAPGTRRRGGGRRRSRRGCRPSRRASPAVPRLGGARARLRYS